jgi:transporter family-2 protein
MLLCFGQTMTGLLIDHFGLFGSEQIPLDVKRAAGALLVLAGIALVNIPEGKKGGEETGNAQGGTLIVYMILSILCGFSCAAQVAINGTLRNITGSPVSATFISMAVGLISIVVLTLIVMVLKGKYGIYDGGRDHGPVTFRAWMPIGGCLAIVIVASNAVAAPVLGTGIVTILNLVGMMAAGLIIDATGFLGIEKKPVTAVKVAGMLLMTGGSALISLL